MADENKNVKLVGSVIGVIFAITAGIFTSLTYLDNAYASTDEVDAMLAPLTSEIKIIKSEQNEFSLEIRELRKDRFRDQIRQIKKEKYGIQSKIDSGNFAPYERDRLQDLDLDLQDIEGRLNTIK